MGWIFAVASGLATVAAFPPFEWWWLGWAAPLLLLLSLRGKTLGQAAGCGLVAGLTFQLLLGWWLFPAGVNAGQYVAGALVCAVWVAAFGAGAAWLERARPGLAPLAVPSLWCVLEWGRANLGWFAAPWGVLGYSQATAPGVAGVATVAGVWGVSFVLVGGAGLALGGLDRRSGAMAPRVPRLVLAASLAGLLGFGATGPPAADTGMRSIRVAVLQAGRYVPGRDQPSDALAVFERYRGLTREAAAHAPALIVWPESALPASLPSDRAARTALSNLAREVKAHLLVASSGRDKSKPASADRFANSAFLFTPEGEIAARYDKIRLLPFNEYVPLRTRVAWPAWIVPDVGDAEAGHERTIFDVDGVRFGALICWENLFGADFRASAAQGVDFMVSLSNEGFEVVGTGRRQLFAINAFRALENGVSLVRASTTGVSGFVARDGRVLARVRDATGRELDSHGFGVQDLVIGLPATFYRRHGDWIVGVAAAMILLAVLFGRTRSPTT